MTVFQLVYHHDIPRDIVSIPRNIRDIIRHAIETRLAVDPLHYGVPLRRSLQGYRKLRVGDYRVIYRISGATVIVLMIGQRKDVYSRVEKRIS